MTLWYDKYMYFFINVQYIIIKIKRCLLFTNNFIFLPDTLNLMLTLSHFTKVRNIIVNKESALNDALS